jgi:hypothetical protein
MFHRDLVVPAEPDWTLAQNRKMCPLLAAGDHQKVIV